MPTTTRRPLRALLTVLVPATVLAGCSVSGDPEKGPTPIPGTTARAEAVHSGTSGDGGAADSPLRARLLGAADAPEGYEELPLSAGDPVDSYTGALTGAGDGTSVTPEQCAALAVTGSTVLEWAMLPPATDAATAFTRGGGGNGEDGEGSEDVAMVRISTDPALLSAARRAPVSDCGSVERTVESALGTGRTTFAAQLTGAAVDGLENASLWRVTTVSSTIDGKDMGLAEGTVTTVATGSVGDVAVTVVGTDGIPESTVAALASAQAERLR